MLLLSSLSDPAILSFYTVGLDYSLLNSTGVQFSPGEMEKEVYLEIVDDSELEESETLSLSLSSGPGATSDSSTSIAGVTITDDDQVMVEFGMDMCALAVTEGAGSVEITVTRVGLSSIPVEVMVQIQNGTATGRHIMIGQQVMHSPSLAVQIQTTYYDNHIADRTPHCCSITLLLQLKLLVILVHDCHTK